MEPVRIAVALSLVASVGLAVPTAAPAHAASATGCAARPDLEHRVLVKKRPVTTRAGDRFGVLRFWGGLTFESPQDDPGPGGRVPAWCLDLVVAKAFAARNPRDRGRVSHDGATTWFSGRASTGVLSAGAGSDLEGQRFEVVHVVDGRRITARRVMRLVYPHVGRPG